MVMLFVVLLSNFLVHIFAQCPRLMGLNNMDANDVEPHLPPSMVPEADSMRIRFIHFDRTKVDETFSILAKTVLTSIQDRLKAHQIRLTLETINCLQDINHAQCTEYSFKNFAHLLVVTDSMYNEEVYSIDKQLNKTPEMVDAAILDVLSRHGNHDFTKCASKASYNVVGFVRRFDKKEMLALTKTHQRLRLLQLIEFSPLELNLIEPNMLEYRSSNLSAASAEQIELNPETLNEIFDSNQLVFLLFWTNVDTVSQHIFYIWSQASTVLRSRNPNVAYGAIPCHLYGAKCAEHIPSKSDYQFVYAYRYGVNYASTASIGDVQYYIEWATSLSNDALIELKTQDELKAARKGILAQFDGVRPAITIGFFNSKDSEEFKIFRDIAEHYQGRYHLAYHLSDRPSAVYTIRVSEKKRRVDYEGAYDMESLIYFISQSSFPTIVDISKGFTSPMLFSQSRPILVLIRSKVQKNDDIAIYCRKDPSNLCTEIVRECTSEFKRVVEGMGINFRKFTSPLLLVLKETSIYMINYTVGMNPHEIASSVRIAIQNSPQRMIETNEVHPLRFLQLGQINYIFGHQNVELRSEPKLAQEHHHIRPEHRVVKEQKSKGHGGGCPYMARANKLNGDDRRKTHGEEL